MMPDSATALSELSTGWMAELRVNPSGPRHTADLAPKPVTQRSVSY